MKSRILLIGLLFNLIGFISAHTGEDDYAHHGMMSGMMGNYGTDWWIFGWLFSILVIVALVLLIIWLVKQIQKK